MKDLKQLLSQLDANSSADEIKSTFSKIAEILKNGCVIQYDEKEYRILDFEFYFYNKNHQDISVHPRKSNALCWYINDFGGIDLNFESQIERDENNEKWSFKYKLTDDSFFGGILIRQIQRLSDKRVFDGPWKVADLFRVLNAVSQEQNNPILVRKQIDPIEFQEPMKRYNLLGRHTAKDKADYILQECFMGVPDSKRHDLAEKLSTFSESKYRFCWKKVLERTI